jgi:hypothetical protein
MTHDTMPAYGLWGLVIINTAVFVIFAFSDNVRVEGFEVFGQRLSFAAARGSASAPPARPCR